MQLYLVQHGEALPAEVDPERPLSVAGEADVGCIAAFLAGSGVRVARILHSGKRRAEETAEALAAALAPGNAPVSRSGLNPNDSTESLALELAEWQEDTMLVGHLPFMARLASRLVVGREDAGLVAFEPGSVVCLQRIDEHGWTIAWMLRPGLLAFDR
jgi:phosphohistidine phosphatase